jgi:adenine-specific DNA-methyltransferase
MMYPRLILARELLSPEGLIAISSDDAELERVRLLCEEVFGENNFVVQIVWKKRSTPPNDKIIGANHDYITVVCKDVERVRMNLRERSDEQVARYRNPDNHPKGPWAPGDLMANVKGGRYAASLDYAIVNPRTGQSHTPGNRGNWRFSRDKVEALIARNEIFFGDDDRGRPKLKRFLCDVKQGVTYPSIWDFLPFNGVGTEEVDKLFDGETVFQSPKPVGLIVEILRLATGEGDLIIDFFAGSGTTGHAVMEQNTADGAHRRYVVVQLPERLDPGSSDQQAAAALCDKLGKPRTIAELTKERLRRAAAKIRADHPDTQADLGFRAYKLATSNLRAWEPGDDLAADLLAAADNIVQGRSEEDLLTELLLKQGIDLTEPMLTETIAGAPVHAMGGGVLMVCLAPVTAANAETLADGIADWIERLDPVAASTVFFKDAGFENDVAKANVAAILEQRLEDKLLKVRSL